MNEISYKKDFISKELEEEVINLISSLPKPKSRESFYKIYRFGEYVAPYNTCQVSDVIPDVFYKFGIKKEEFDSITVNEFIKDQYIPFHYDSPCAGEKIVVVSLKGNSELTLKKGSEEKTYKIEPRSLFVLEGDLRWKWQHSSKALEERISVVFRKSVKKVK